MAIRENKSQVQMWHLLVAFASTVLVAVSMQFTMAEISATTGGGRVFDSMLFGYSFEEFKANMELLGDEGRWMYLIQFTFVNMFFPFLYGLTAVIAWELAALSYPPSIYNLGKVITLIEVVVDYLENMRLGILLIEVAPITERGVAITSNLTVGKWIIMFVFLALLLAVFLHGKFVKNKNK